MTALFDTHAHYTDEKFDSDRAEILSVIQNKCEENPLGVEFIVNCADSIESSRASIELAGKYSFIYASVGIHPHEADSFSGESISVLKELFTDPKVVAIGEIGLDYHYDFSPRDKQAEAFRAQMALAEELGAPVIIHDREAHGPTMDIIREFPNVRGILHSFSGSREMARELVRLGWMISYSGSVTFKNAVNLRETASMVPLSNLLIETDSPYLAPVPYRGRRNNSSLMYATAACLAEIYAVSVEELAKITSINAKSIFKL